MKLAKITAPDINNGIGCRVSIWISGCKHYCPHCFNNQLFDYNYGKDFIIDNVIEDIHYYMSKPYIAGISLLGGDPLYQSEEDLVLLHEFLVQFRVLYPNKSVWLYTGFTYEDAIQDEYKRMVIDMCDVMVDGPFIYEKRDRSLPFRGSSNQRIIDLHNIQDSVSEKPLQHSSAL